MKAPDRITLSKYNITKDGDVVFAWLTNSPDCEPMIHPVEYTRTDAYIAKACDAYCKVCGHYAHTVPTHICRHDCRYFSDFKKYMKGE